MLKVNVGDQLVRVSGGVNTRHSIVTVTKVTKTQCTTDGGARWMLASGSMVGVGGGGWRSPFVRHLRDGETPEGIIAEQEKKDADKRSSIENAQQEKAEKIAQLKERYPFTNATALANETFYFEVERRDGIRRVTMLKQEEDNWKGNKQDVMTAVFIEISKYGASTGSLTARGDDAWGELLYSLVY